MSADCISAEPIARHWAHLFALRWVLDREGHDPCDEWSIEELLRYPEGLHYRNGRAEYECERCGNWAEWPVEPGEFVYGDDMNLCGGSPRCCP